jgi:histidine ammonia-lyase
MTQETAASVVLDGRGLTPADVAAVVRHGLPVSLAGDARARNAAAAVTVEELVELGTPIYGVTTGVGGLRAHEIPPDQRSGQQLRLLRSHSCGAGRPLPPELVRATMVVRANQLGVGGGGVSDELLTALVAAVNAGVVPFTRELGSLGTADLMVLADVALALLGEGRAWRGREVVDAREVLADAGLAVPRLGPRDGIAFMSSNAMSIGHAALVTEDARRLIGASLPVASLSFAAAGADPVAVDARVQDARAHPGQSQVAARMRELLDGSPASAGAEPPRDVVHDPYPFRALAQVEGATVTALGALDAVLAVELNSASENALIDRATSSALSGANFHGGSLALALDHFRAALAQSVSLVASRVSALLDRGLMGLPPALAERPGADSGAMMLEYTAHAAAADVRLRASPVTAQTVTVGGGVESHASFAPFAAREAQDALDSVAVAMATELVVAVRALRMRGVEPGPGVAGGLFALAAERLEADTSDRSLSDDVEAARLLLLTHDA